MRLRKACRSCAKAKRRCRPQLPQCPRCFDIGLECVYDLEPLARVTNPSHQEKPVTIGFSHELQARHSQDRHDVDPILCEFVGSLHLSLNVIGQIPGGEGIALWRRSTQSVPIQPDNVTLSFMIDRLKQLPASFLESQSAPFLHRRLYSRSQMRQTEKLYSSFVDHAQTPFKPFRSFRFSNTLDTAEMPNESELSLLDALASMHYLIFLLIPKLFDESQRLTAKTKLAEAQLRTLVRRAEHLYFYAPQHTLSHLSPWRAWILGESVRRTILAAYLLRGVYSSSKYGFCLHELFVYALPLDATSGAWEAGSANEWSRVKSGQTLRSSMISVHELTSSFMQGSLTDVGAFETMILVSHHGKLAMEKHLLLTT